MKKIIRFLFILILALVVSLQAHAELIVRGTDSNGFQLIYDTDLDITWYDYTNSGLYVTGYSWQSQLNWASALTVNFDGTLFDDWRLPSTVDGPYVYGFDGTTTAGFNITSSEMGHLFYTELGNKAYYSTSGQYQSGYGLTNTGPFVNLRTGAPYWSMSSAANANSVWDFRFSDGYQYVGPACYYLEHDYVCATEYALAVRSGDIAAAVVPEPISSILFVTGGTLLAGRRYLRRRK